MLCGVLGYIAFGNDAPQYFRTGFGFYDPFWLIDVVNICIVIHLLGAYQLYKFQEPLLLTGTLIRTYRKPIILINNAYEYQIHFHPPASFSSIARWSTGLDPSGTSVSKSDFQWTAKAEVAFKQIKKLIAELPTLNDYCFECVGLSSLVHEAYASCRKGWGKTVVLGVDKLDATLTFNSFEVLHSGKPLMGSYFGGLKPKSDIHIFEKCYLDNELQLDKFVTHEVDFKDINKVFDLLHEGKSLRCVIWMNK
uniref:Alcohol dehydrogenase-like 7 n=1 Tax=Tanacetum cinerariifolium TaxID=118510 RepID=A0A699JRU6_TANCI|nr:alcohol dehydrogenase-like 7 [Tanacetum cinerariifolium]